VIFALKVSNVEKPSGTLKQNDNVFVVETGTFFQTADELQNMVVNVVDGARVYLRDVAEVIDGPAAPVDHTWIGCGPASGLEDSYPDFYPAVTIAVAKRKGSNAVWVADDLLERLEQLEAELFPPEVNYRIIRNYGETADEKVSNLVSSLLTAVLTVVIF